MLPNLATNETVCIVYKYYVTISSMKLERYSPLGLNIHEKIKTPTVPNDLKFLVSQLFEINRFTDEKYPPGIFFDNVGEHTFRLVALADTVKIYGVNNSTLKRMLWIHDIPELITGEYIAPRKQNDKNLAELLEREEIEAAGNLLNINDVGLIESFNLSGKHLKGEIYSGDVTKEGIVACTLDKIDGNMFFHYSMAKWVNIGHGEREIPSKTAMEFTFKQRNLFLKNLGKLPNEYESVVNTCENLLNYQVNFVVDCWKSVDEGKRPQIIKDQLKKYASR